MRGAADLLDLLADHETHGAKYRMAVRAIGVDPAQ
jgi:hypothetical protein